MKRGEDAGRETGGLEILLPWVLREQLKAESQKWLGLVVHTGL